MGIWGVRCHLDNSSSRLATYTSSKAFSISSDSTARERHVKKRLMHIPYNELYGAFDIKDTLKSRPSEPNGD